MHYLLTEHNAYFITIRGCREDFPRNMTAEETKIMKDHFDYLQGLMEKGKLIMAGRNLDNDSGYIILNIKSLDEAKTLMSNDPSVKKNVIQPVFEEFRVSMLKC